MKKWAIRLALVAGGVLFAGTVAEAVLRALDVVPLEASSLRGYNEGHEVFGWIGTPDHVARFRAPEFDLVIANGPEGFRRSEVPFDGPDTAPTTVFLGDSFTWGWGVAQGEVFTDRLQEELQGERRILNRAINGYGTGQERLLLEELLQDDPPDAVVVMFFNNDPAECIDARGGQRAWYSLEDGRLVSHNLPVRVELTSPFRDLVKRSIVLSHVRSAVNNLTRPIRDGGSSGRETVGRDGVPHGWEVCSSLLLEMRDACASAGVAFEIVYIPRVSEVTVPPEDPPPMYVLRALLLELCEGAGIRVLDLTDGFREAWSENEHRTPTGLPYYYPRDRHWTAEGHRLAARLLREEWVD